MENKIITMMELLQRIYNNNAPKKIKYDGQRYKLHELLNVYEAEETGNQLGYNYKLDLCLNDKVEIIPEENDKWEDIEEINVDKENCKRFIEYDSETGHHKYTIRLLDEYFSNKINQLIKNQKYLKKKLESKNER